MKYTQRDPRWTKILMGFGDGTIGNYGCYLTSLASGLSEKSYNFDPEILNQLLKDVDAWVGPYKNYIDVLNLEKYLPDIFVSFEQIEPWNDVPTLAELIKTELIVVCKVSAIPIGGTGTHFVLLTGQENGIAKIWDPWSGVEELITKRWNSYGNILGIRIFEIKVSSSDIINNMEMLPKDNVIKDIRTALCGLYSQDEINADLATNENLVQIVTRICSYDDKFKNKWIPIVECPVTPPSVPGNVETPETSTNTTPDTSINNSDLLSRFITWLIGLFTPKK